MARRLPPLDALRTFECAGRHESFVLAADEPAVTTGAVSRQVKAPEAWLGALLLEQNDEWAVQRARYMTPETIGRMSHDPPVSLQGVAR